MYLFEHMMNEIFGNNESAIAKDLKLNFKRYLTQNSLSEKNTMLVAYSLAGMLKLNRLETYAKSHLNALEFSTVQIKEAREISAFMKMLNTYYKFKNFVNNHPDYNLAGLRMNAMGKPNLTKVEFEILALAHSLANGCEFCVKSHEHELKQLGLTADNIHDIARLVSILVGVTQLEIIIKTSL